MSEEALTTQSNLWLADTLWRLGAVQFGDFTLGRTTVNSPIYVNLRLLIAHPTALQKAFDSFTHWEAWAHDSEQLILDTGYGAGDLAQQAAQLYAALLRNARYMVAIGMHCEGISVDQATRSIMETTTMAELPVPSPQA